MNKRLPLKIRKPSNASEWRLAWWLGGAYFLELYNFLGLKIMLGVGGGDFYRDVVQRWELAGMLGSLLVLGLWIWKFNRFQPRCMDILKYSILVQAVLGILTVGAVVWTGALSLPDTNGESLLKVVRMVWGVSLGFGLGSSFAILSRAFSRQKRTFVAALVVGAGLSGPLVITPVSYFPGISKWIYAAVPLAFLGLVIGRWRRISALEHFWVSTEDQSPARIDMDPSVRRNLREPKFWRAFIWLLLSGLNVQFCVNFLLADPSKFGETPYLQTLECDAYHKLVFDIYRWCVFGRYFFFIAGVFFFGWLSSIWWKSRRKPFIVTGLFGLICIPLYIRYFTNLDYSHVNPVYIVLWSGLIGFSNSNWLITLLQGIEMYGRRLQFIVLFSLPMFYRFAAGAPVLLSWRPDNEQTLYLGIAITLVGLLSAFLWEENFEGANNLRISDDNVDRNFSVAILDHQTRQNFKKEVDGATWKNENLGYWQQRIVNVLEKRFLSVFEEWMYCFNLAATDIQDGQLKFSETKVNAAAYRDLGRVTAGDAAQYQSVAHELILDEHPARSLTKFAINNGLNGLVLTHKDNLSALDRTAYQENDYGFFDLSNIQLPDDAAIAEFWQAQGKAQEELFNTIFKAAETSAREQEDSEKIPEILTLRALDSRRYPSEYFLYIITPQSALQSESQQRLALLLLTAIKIPVAKLDELAGTLNWLLAQRALALTVDAEYRKISEEQSHSMKTVFGLLLNDVKALNDYKLYSDGVYTLQESLEINIRRLDRINQFTLALMRAGDVGDVSQVDAKVQKVFQTEVVDLRAMICEVLQEIGKTVDTIGFTVDGHDAGVKALIPRLIQSVEQQENLQVRVVVVPTGLQIVLTDLLGNMLFYTNPKAPEATIALIDKEDAYWLCLTNNRKIDDKYRTLIESSKDQSGISIRRKAGIRMVKRILGTPLFYQKSNKRWTLGVITPDEHHTTIVLKITKND